LYSAQEENPLDVTIDEFNKTKIIYTEVIKLNKNIVIGDFVYNSFDKRYSKFKKKFRDGQDSRQRNFDIINKIIGIKDDNILNKPTVEITISIKGNNQNDSFEVQYKNCKSEEKMDITKLKGSVFEHEFIIQK